LSSEHHSPSIDTGTEQAPYKYNIGYICWTGIVEEKTLMLDYMISDSYIYIYINIFISPG